MGKKLYIGNLGSAASSADLDNLFSDHGTVCRSRILTDEVTGRSKGVGMVEMGSEEEAQAAVAALDGTTLDGRVLTVSEMRPMRSAGGRPGMKKGPLH